MPTGLKQTSSVVSIGFSVAESAANTFTEDSVDLNLSPLDREVFVVLAINLDADFPDNDSSNTTFVKGGLTTTSQLAAGTMPSLSDANCLARITNQIMADTQGAQGGVGFSTGALETPPATLEYIGIIATNDFFVQAEGRGNAGINGVSGKLYGYRARADAEIYAALVQSEVLSA